MTDIAKEVSEICENDANLNKIQDYLTSLKSSSGTANVLSKTKILDGVFQYYEKYSDLLKDFDAVNERGTSKNVLDRQSHISGFLSASFRSFFEILISKLTTLDGESASFIMKTTMNLIKLNYSLFRYRNNTLKETMKINFPYNYFSKVVNILVSTSWSPEIVENIRSMTRFDDLRFYIMKNIFSLIKYQQGNIKLNLENVFEILLMCSAHNVPSKDNLNIFLINRYDCNIEILDVSVIYCSYKEVFSNCWIEFLRQPDISISLQRKALVVLDSKVIPYLVDPKILIDFLTDNYNMGGINSLLALNGLFILINQYNLDYPDFYTKLYGLISPNIFHVRYKSRFFNLLDLFLSSTYLPSYVVEAFIKKIIRISLFTPAADTELLLIFIKNLFIRHPSTEVLIHRKNVSETTDPYNYEEEDPSKCFAVKSSLWELDTLKSHYSSKTISLASSFKKNFQQVVFDISDYCDEDFNDVTIWKMNKEKSIPLNFVKKGEIFIDFNNDMWVLE